MLDPNSLPPGARPHKARTSTASGTLAVPRWASAAWLLLVGLAIAEVIALRVREARVPTERDWQQAAELVRKNHDSSDAIVVAPTWADPLLRLHLGDRITAKVAGRADLAAFERLWVLSIRGARAEEAPYRAADFRSTFGGVTVERFDFGPTPVVMDFVDALPSASVEIANGKAQTNCPWNAQVAGAARGGLGFGPVFPRQRFVCDEKRPWLWVGSTIIEDLSLAPRRCIWQHPQGREPVSVTFHDVHLGKRLVLYGGLDYHHERDEVGAPVTMRVFVSGREIGRMVHRDGDGMKRVVIDTQRSNVGLRGDLRFEVTSPAPNRRSFCWTGSIQDATRREAP
jgi:hypothetical protein